LENEKQQLLCGKCENGNATFLEGLISTKTTVSKIDTSSTALSTNVDNDTFFALKKNNMNSDISHVDKLPSEITSVSTTPVDPLPTQKELKIATEFIAFKSSSGNENCSDVDENSLSQAVEAIDFLDTIEFIEELNSDGESVGVDVDALEEHLL
jgi:hypothetical protein